MMITFFKSEMSEFMSKARIGDDIMMFNRKWKLYSTEYEGDEIRITMVDITDE